ncbi:DNA-dependent protein kinase catalytic subunit-like [Phymastichus coffea]|uniref:DNA-dependent protein kinase catalytic subunit-like n=1 Tax=Phymastichus coffea TaxID=108790 RepID=UPI00273C4809|nr:DNA-dependent protein kinase catalytic subunit-like [Phymastichus coffea]
MESVNSYMEVFQRSWKEGNNDSLVAILKYGNNYLKNVPQSEGERALEIIFEKERGLLKFIQSTLLSNNIVQFNGAVKEAFTISQWIMEFFKNDYEPYIKQTRDQCFVCIKSHNWFFLRKTGAETLKKLIELFPNHDMALNEIVQHYNKFYPERYSVKDGCVFYIVLGAIAKYCPAIESMSTSNFIYMQILRDINNQFKGDSSKQPEELKIYMECLSNMLVNYIPFEGSEKQEAYCKKLYFYISELCKPMQAQKTIRNIALFIFTRQMEYFSSFIKEDYLMWHNLLNNIFEKADNYTVYDAIRTFYKTMAKNMLEENENHIFSYFKTDFMKRFGSDNFIHDKKKPLIIYGLGELAAAYAKFLPGEIYKLFQMLAVRALPFYEKEEIDKDFEMIIDYLQSLSKVLIHMPEVTKHQLNVVIELSICLAKKFPQYTNSFQKYSTKVLKIIFVNISQLDNNLHSEYFVSFFYEGILWSCSHAISIDVELQQEIEPNKENWSYKNYLLFWQSLFQDEDPLFLQIFDYFVQTLTTFIDKLNLNLTVEHNECFSNPLLSMKAVNETDYRFFINLTDLYCDIFDSIDSVLFQNWIEKLFIYFIKSSYSHPLVSGFYKFIEVILTKPDVLSEYKETFNRSSSDLISQYLVDIVTLIPTYSGELQLSCINLIFSIPSSFVLDVIDKLTVTFKIAFRIGLTNLSLAFNALETLENWSKNSDIKFSNEFYMQIVHSLEPYLSSEEYSLEMFECRRKKQKDIKNIVMHIDDNLKVFQSKILLFYGSLDSNILFDFIHQKTIITNATWNKKDLLQCELLYSDCRLEIHYDKLILRIIDLTKSGDRQTKLSACEFLHSIITIILGKKLMDQCFNRNLCRTILSLGCDPDDVIRNLYHPLIIQLTHFLSSQLMKESRVPQDFLDSLFEGLSEEFNSSMNDYCGIYLKEFTQWSIKQSTENNLTDVPNIRSVLLRIINLASYSSDKNQRAAAIAFNYIHSTLSEEHNDILNTYWLEFLYVFVKSMEHSCNIEIITAVDHIEADIKLKANVFLAKSPSRKKPACFVKETLKGALIWLFDECGSLNVKCRSKRMTLFENLLLLINYQNNFQDVLSKNVHKIALKDLREDVTIENANVFLKSLDFYIWVLQKNIISAERLFADRNELHLFSQCFSNFLSKIVNENAESLDNVKLFNLFGTISLKILEYTIATKDNNSIVPIWHKDFYSLLSRCILNPSSVGLTVKNLELIEKLPGHFRILLTLMINSQKKECQGIILNDVRIYSSNFTDFRGLISLKNNTHTLQDFVQGLIILKQCKFIDFEKELNFDDKWIEDRLKELFESLKHEIMNEDICKKLDDNVKNYFNILLNFLLFDCQNQILETLITLLMNKDPLLRPNGSIISHGEYFLETFKTPILHSLIANTSETLKIIDGFFIKSPNKSFLLIEELVRFSKTLENTNLFDEIIQRFDKLKRQINNITYRQEKFLSIYRIAITLKKKPTHAVKNSELYWWILEQLSSATELEKKNMLLRNFLVCLVDESTKSPEVSMIFRHLRHQDSAVYLREFTGNDALKFQAASCFQILSKSLIATKSLIVFEALLKFSAGILTSIFKGNTHDYVALYFSSITNVTALKSLHLAYRTFMDLSLTNDRLSILYHFLLPSIKCCNFSVVNSFYIESHADMVSIISTNVVFENPVDAAKLSTSKIGCFNIFEILFAQFDLPIVKINDKSINQLIILQSLDIRRIPSADRLLHCAALNCCIALVSLKDEQKYYKYVFVEDRRKNQLLWERIVDCSKEYTFTEDSLNIRKERKKLLNIRRKIQPMTDDYLRKPELTSLTLFENIHAYDLNDIRLLTQPKTDSLLGLSFENDELNNHECMPMLVGLLVHMFNNAIASTTKTDELPDFLKMFRNGFGTQMDNVRLFLLRIVSNVKQAFLPFMSHFFLAIVSTLSSYLANNALNYIIRDTLLILIESKTQPTSDQEKLAANRLLQKLIERVPEAQNVLTHYNINLLESLWTNWFNNVSWPGDANVKSLIAARISLVVLRSQAALTFSKTNEAKALRDLVIASLEQINAQESESNIIAGFETLGWLLKFNVAEESLIDKLDLLLVKMEINNVERSAKCVCALYRGWSSEEGCKKMFRFTNRLGRLTDSVKSQCIELFISRLDKLDPSVLTAELSLMNLKPLLLNHTLSCEGPILNLLEKLVPLLPENELKAYTDIVSNSYYSEPQCCLLEHRRRVYRFLGATNCLKPLIRALAFETSDELRRELLDFWTTKLPEGCQDRLVELLKLYEPNVGFSRFICLLMLELTKKAPDNQRTMFRPLNDKVVFHEYELLVPWRRKNLASCAPLFLPSLASASQMLQHKQIASSCNSQFSQDAYWQPLVSYTNTSTLPEPSRNKLSIRTFTERLSQDCYHDKLRLEAKKKIRTRRSFRIGDLPDIEITQESFVDGLQHIIVIDSQCCRQMTINILEKLIERARNDENEARKNRLQNVITSVSEKATDDFGPILLEAIIHYKELLKEVNVTVAARVCNTLGYHSLATLLIEQRLISKENTEDDIRPLKLPRLQNDNNDERGIWAELAKLYRAIELSDVVSGIYSRPDVFSVELRQAAQAHAAAEWLEAKNAYELAFDEGPSLEKQYCFEGMLECLAQLGSWSKISQKLKNEDVRHHSRKDYLLPRMIESQLHQALDELTSNGEVQNRDFIKNLDSWLGDSRIDFPEQMCVFYLCGEDSENSARHALKHAIDRLRNRWVKFNEKKPVELRAVYNIYAYAQLLKSQDMEEATKELMKSWELNGPQLGQDLLSWNKLVGYRLTFAHLLHEKIQNDNSQSSLLNDLIAAGVSQRLKLSNMAISLRNNIVAKKHTIGAERTLESLSKIDYSKLHEDFLFTASKYKLICAHVETNPRKKFKYYVGAWQIAHNLLSEAQLRIDVQQHIFDVTVELRSAIEENLDFVQSLLNEEFVVEKLSLEREEDLFEALRKYSYETIKSACETGESFAKFGKYCYSLLRQEPLVIEDFISAILTGMSLGSLQATQYFSCLLKYQFYHNNEFTTRLFKSKCESVPSWLFISWQAQIMSYLNKPFGESLVPIIRRLAKEYPQAIMYNFKQSYESFPELKENDNIRCIYEELFRDGKVEKYCEAMHRVCQPELYLRHYLLKVFEESKDHRTVVDSLLGNQENIQQGSLYKVLEKFRPQLERMKTLDYEAAKKLAEDISCKLYESMKRRLDKAKLHSVQLKDYSPYLADFTSDKFEIEIPGQYVDGKRPLPQYHVIISRFDRFVHVMNSKWNPIRINFIGNDGKSYGYLVKFGEDLRQDQRLQQIFRLTNKTLQENVKCRQRYLSVNTYHVIPLSMMLGLIEWVDETRSLKEFIEFSMSGKAVIEKVARMYETWIELAKRPRRQSYKEALLKYSTEDVVTKMHELIGYIDWDCLRRSFLNISTSLQSFITLRHNFVTSYATMCLIHWLTGVGDRHLENILVKVKTGKCCGIDFGAAFGAGVDQSVPELVPFRLTPQIVGLFQPFDEQALFGITMTRVLSTLRDEKAPILAFLDTFVHEPIDWSKYARKKLKENDEERKDVKWMPKKRIAIIEQKLSGVKPSKIMIEELANMHDDTDEENKYFSKYEVIVNGIDQQHITIRSMMKNEFLTPKEQVRCLLDQATDLNLLGRMWLGWMPFV